MRILRYSISMGDDFIIPLPVDYKIVNIIIKHNSPYMLIETAQNLDIACPHINVMFKCVPTGEEYLGTYIDTFEYYGIPFHLIQI
jgi:hypothetical protein